MSGSTHDASHVPWWGVAAPVCALALYGVKAAHLVVPDSPVFLAAAVVLLGGAVFAAVHHAEVVALRIGEPFGSVILAIAITIIEVGLIVSVMASASAAAETVARDTVFSAVLIVLNGIVGLCLVVGGVRHHEQDFKVEGAAAILSVIATLAILALVLPNFTLTTVGPTYSSKQLMFVGFVSLVLYCVFVFVQTVRHRDYFIVDGDPSLHAAPPGLTVTLVSAALLVVSLIGVIVLAKALSPVVEGAVASAGLPHAVVGVVIATVVLLPEGLASLRAASLNRLQTSMNAALGSALASIGLTIPAVAVVSISLDQKLALGVGPDQMVLLLLTLFISTLTFATGRTTVLQGVVHLVIFGVFLFLSAVP